MNRYLVIMMLLFAYATSVGPRSQTSKSDISVNHQQTQKGIHPLMNAQIPNFATGQGVITLRNAKARGADFSLGLDTENSSHAQGDFFGSGSEGIAAFFVSSEKGSGELFTLAVFKVEGGVPQYIASVPMGDRIIVNKVSFANGIFSADIVAHAPGDGMCCPTLRTVLKYRVQGDKLVEPR